MNAKILVTFATTSGSTADIAETIAKTLQEQDMTVDIRPVRRVDSIDDYDTVIVGAPMILGWHRDAMRFVQQHAGALSTKKVGYFFTSLNLTTGHIAKDNGNGFFIDPMLGTPPKNPDKLSMAEQHTTPQSYLNPVQQKAPDVKPMSVAFFGGKLDYSTLSLPARLFVKLIIRAEDGDRRNWHAVRDWSQNLNQRVA